jgi:hypothetical protein
VRATIAIVTGMIAASLTATAQAQVLHFKVTGDYKAQTVIAFEETGGQATVSDRVIVEFDKDTKTGKVANLRFQNFPSTASDLRNVERSCPPPAPKGAYEHLDVTGVTYDGSGTFELKGTRSYPEIQVTAYCQGSWAKKTVKAKQAPAQQYLAMIEGNEPTVFTIKLDDGWTWNYVTTRAGK